MPHKKRKGPKIGVSYAGENSNGEGRHSHQAGKEKTNARSKKTGTARSGKSEVRKGRLPEMDAGLSAAFYF